METEVIEPSWDVLVGLVGRRVVAASRLADGPVPLTVADVTDAVTCDGGPRSPPRWSAPPTDAWPPPAATT